MEKLSYQRHTCRLCQSRDLLPVLKLAPTPIADAYVSASKVKQKQPVFPLDLLLCRNCGNAQIRDVVDPKILYLDYLYEATSSLGFVRHFEEYARQVIKEIKPAGGSLIIDVGSNDGTLLRAYKARGFRVLGIDPAKRIAGEATRSGIETLPHFLSLKLARLIRKKYGPAAVVCANNVYANVDDLDEFTSGIKKLLSSTGVYIFESFYLPDTIKNMVFDFIEHEHLSYFTVAPLDKYFRKQGMELIDVQQVNTKGGSLRYTVQLSGGKRKQSAEVKKYVANENKIAIHTPLAFRKFNRRITRAKKDLQLLLGKLQKQGKTIAGYGASAQSTSLIYHFGLTGKLEYLVDDYKRKQGTFSPGAHIPVFPSNVIYRKKPDFIVIVAWRYSQPIIDRNRQFLKHNGAFIIPLPKLKIIRQ